MFRTTGRSVSELVKEARPSAFAHEERGLVVIRVRLVEMATCPECTKRHQREVEMERMPVIGSGCCEACAWINAAKKLGLRI